MQQSSIMEKKTVMLIASVYICPIHPKNKSLFSFVSFSRTVWLQAEKNTKYS